MADFFPWPWLLLVFSFTGAAGAVFFLGSRKKLFWPLLLLFFFAGAARGAAAKHLFQPLPPAWDGREIEIAGIVADSPVPTERGWRFLLREEGTRRLFMVYLPLPEGEKSSVAVSPPVEYGTRLWVRGEGRVPPQALNPGQFDYRRYLYRHGVSALLFAQEVEKDGQERSILTFIHRLRRRFLALLAAGLGQEEGSLLQGIVWGAEEDIPAEVTKIFRETGVVHILSVSGLHVGMVAALLTYLTAGINRRGVAFCLTAGGVLFYVLLVGLEPPVIRSAVMFLFYLLARYLRRPAAWPQALALAVIVILLGSPAAVWEAGFQFSVAATAAILFFLPLGERLGEKGAEALSRLRFPPGESLLKKFVAVVGVSLAAQLGTLPLSAYHFSQFPLLSLPANLVAVPLTALLLYAGLLKSLLGFFSPGLAGFLNPVLAVLSRLFLKLMELFAGPGGQLYLHLPAAVVGLIYGGVFLLLHFASPPGKRRLKVLLWWHRRFWERRWYRLVAGTLTLLIAAGLFFSFLTWGRKELEVNFLAVGEGDAAVIFTPAGRVIVVDAGPEGAGRRVVAPFLKRKGKKTIDLLIITHPHQDHYGGVAELAEDFYLQAVVAPAEGEGLYRQLRENLRRQGISFYLPREGTVLISGEELKLEVLAYREKGNNTNDSSIVIKLTCGHTAFFLPGDLEKAGQEELLARFRGEERKLVTTVLKAPHHGGESAFLPALLLTVKPQAIVIPVGPNEFGHPSPALLDFCRQQGIAVFRTDEKGAVTCRSNGERVSISTWCK